MAKKRGGDFRSVLERLRRADLEKIADRESIHEQHRSIWRAMQASVEMLPEDEQKRFAELSVFATDQTVPEAALATLWAHTGGLDDLDTEELLISLAERSLVRLDQKETKGSPVQRRFSLHDLLHDYAVRVTGNPKAAHRGLLDAYRRECPSGWPSGPDDGYFLQNLCGHLIQADEVDDAVALLTDGPWVITKCRVGLVFSLKTDYRDVIDVLPEAQAGLEQERQRQERLTRYTAELIEYARAWSARHDEEAAAKREGRELPPFREPRLPDPPATVRMWTEEEIAAECRRITEAPTRLDCLNAFAGFLGSECYPLLQYGDRDGFVVQHAFNSAPAGPVALRAQRPESLHWI
jgi:hypothetical protein